MPDTGAHRTPAPVLWRRLWRFVGPHKGKLGLVVLLNALAAFADVFSFTLLVPFFNAFFQSEQLIPATGTIGRVLDTTIGFLLDERDRMGSLRNVLLIVIAAVTLKNTLVWLSGQLGVKLQEFVVRDLRDQLYAHLLRLPLPWFTRNKVGQIIARVLNDTGNAKTVVTELVTRSLWSGAQLVATLVAMFTTSWRLSLAALVIAPVTIGAIQPVLRKLRQGYRRLGNEQGEMTSLVQEVVSGVRLVKSYRAEGREEARFTAKNNAFARGFVKVGRLALLSGPVIETLGTLTAVIILWYGAQLVLVEGSLTGAELLVFLVQVMRLLQPLKQLSQTPAAAQQSLASAERVFEILDAPAETTTDRGTRDVATFEREIAFSGVGFQYDGGAAALQDVTFTARKGEVVALVGASGAGKSTLVDLLPRFLDPTAGRITLDGVDLREIRLGALRALTGIVSQDTVLFNDTVRANVAFGRPDATQAQLDDAARAANALAFIEALPEGWDTNLGERGSRLSGGQRQRVAIARALVSDPPILILDEATSALDVESERLVQEAIDRLLEGRTVFVIAHRLATIQHADRILVLDGGRLVEEGAHDALLARGGPYARLHALQFDRRSTDEVAEVG
ncbi:MAG: ABC transporter ATP-binding protein [Gemmatimonas sp.]|jgi:subfamily B ATP-binding cassette protein MsbA|uniref:ABC transporter ATP-binding protein n=1 Tax=Gemmatimonas sp. TaxID=1962908 RepID=UPI0022C926BA|nr:ABC transporter ATP-binding protein [Gemmatimonas sp.]MCA2984032.1 ABC transporter ATP-binding protein [Gemmatimonas sp.]MCA2996404.1 ABC transporter ATP-binding protein [Gemmatimonas sp.]MCE2952919.1 ABC transporter ATP-binding protein/permease [Gemmatimonas sp.]MCZ8011828.1 ABC transporter ATP-binding protein [Gemmatimonas sp.]MCZ8265623.1 ABC transporter ATP-binding protein [Gemmatimonas sp.]